MTDPVRAIADAVLYEGYMLWPYRRSALKNQRRWTFGGVYPRGAQRGATPTTAGRCGRECLLEGGDAPRSTCACASCTWCAASCSRDGEPVDELAVDGERHISWEEATERELGRRRVARSAAGRSPPGSERGAARRGAARVVRCWRGWTGSRRRCAATRICRPGCTGDACGSRTPPRSAARPRGGARADASARRHAVLRAGGAASSCRSPTRPSELRAAGRRVRATRACGRCSSASRATADTCWRRRSSWRTTRGSRPRAPATSSTAARSTRCSC